MNEKTLRFNHSTFGPPLMGIRNSNDFWGINQYIKIKKTLKSGKFLSQIKKNSIKTIYKKYQKQIKCNNEPTEFRSNEL